ncbi:heterokaryon incompatibility protein-domain-containing protein, partial [Massariosphaeria phaeospora]
QECLSSHDECCLYQKAALYKPSRLIDTQIEDRSQLRLVFPKDAVPYLTLSHCWGSADSIKLSYANLDRLLDGFDDQDLPRLFRDCVTVVRRLGFRYLWIDSLCILQDSTEDWLHEAGRMGDIYRGSICTIAAVSA